MHKTRKLAYIAVFGSLWGAFMAVIGVIIVLSGVLIIEQRGAVLSMGVVTVFLKLFSIGAIFFSPMIAILAEATLGEALVSILGRNRISFALAGAAMTGYCFLHRFISQTLFFGRDILDVYLEYIRLGVDIFGIPQHYAYVIVSIFLFLHFALGACAGLAAL